jgi:hypothetical protein
MKKDRSNWLVKKRLMLVEKICISMELSGEKEREDVLISLDRYVRVLIWIKRSLLKILELKQMKSIKLISMIYLNFEKISISDCKVIEKILNN